MRIAIIRKKYTFHGGAEGFSQSFIKNLARQGHEVHIYAIKWESEESMENIFFHRIPAVTWNSVLRDLTFALFSLTLLKKKRRDFDIIQTHDKTLFQDIYRAGDGCHIEWLRQRWKGAGYAIRMSVLLNPYHWLILIVEWIIFKYHRFKKVIAISEFVKQTIIDNYHVNKSDIEVIYNGVDLEKFHPKNKQVYREAIRREYSIESTSFVVLFVGSGFERKGVKHLIRAVELINDPVAVLIVGRGSEKKFSHLIRRQKFIFCGPQLEIQRYYAASDIFVFPTIYEPFGNVHLEALASGLPVITTGKSGASEVIREGFNGYVIRDPEDVTSIAAKIEMLMEEGRRRDMAQNARQSAEVYTYERNIAETLSLYRSL